MKKLLFIIIFFLAIPSIAFAEEITISVTGMVCAFCAQGIKKQFSAIAGVEKVEPSLEKNFVVVTTKDGTILLDDQIKKLINDAGFGVTAIERK